MHIVVFIWLQSYEALGVNCNLKVWFPLTLATVESKSTSRLVVNSLEGVNGTLHRLCSVVIKSHHTEHAGTPTGGTLAGSLTTVACFTMIFIIFSIWAPCILKVAVFTPLNTRGTVIVLVIYIFNSMRLIHKAHIGSIYSNCPLSNEKEVSVERIEGVACKLICKLLVSECKTRNQIVFIQIRVEVLQEGLI